MWRFHVPRRVLVLYYNWFIRSPAVRGLILIRISLGWMMWNYLISGLQVGMTLVLYDGSPLKDPSYLWRLSDELRITVFGTR